VKIKKITASCVFVRNHVLHIHACILYIILSVLFCTVWWYGEERYIICCCYLVCNFVLRKTVLSDCVSGHHSSIFKNKSILTAHVVNWSPKSSERKRGMLHYVFCCMKFTRCSVDWLCGCTNNLVISTHAWKTVGHGVLWNFLCLWKGCVWYWIVCDQLPLIDEMMVFINTNSIAKWDH